MRHREVRLWRVRGVLILVLLVLLCVAFLLTGYSLPSCGGGVMDSLPVWVQQQPSALGPEKGTNEVIPRLQK